MCLIFKIFKFNVLHLLSSSSTVLPFSLSLSFPFLSSESLVALFLSLSVPFQLSLHFPALLSVTLPLLFTLSVHLFLHHSPSISPLSSLFWAVSVTLLRCFHHFFCCLISLLPVLLFHSFLFLLFSFSASIATWFYFSLVVYHYRQTHLNI